MELTYLTRKVLDRLQEGGREKEEKRRRWGVLIIIESFMRGTSVDNKQLDVMQLFISRKIMNLTFLLKISIFNKTCI